MNAADASSGSGGNLAKDGEDSAPYGILVVEDHLETLQALAQLLKNDGFKVKTASTASQAMRAAETETFDLVISDIGLPDASGYDLVRELHQRFGLRGICLSGEAVNEASDRFRDSGFLAHLMKPIIYERLKAEILKTSLK